MTDQPGSRSDKARRFYDATAAAAADFSFMNYGYAPLSNPAAPEPERYCLELYRRLLGDVTLRGRQVLEVSCGRGGGAAYVAASHRPARYVGVDISERNIELARCRFANVAGLSFQVANAEELPFPDSSFDAAINVEASHLYDDHGRFFAEVRRVLIPEGTFFYADLFWRDSDPERLLAEAGFAIAHEEDITPRVLQALELDSERREQIVTTRIPEPLRHDFRDWSGIKGYRAYERFASGEWVYRCFRAQRRE